MTIKNSKNNTRQKKLVRKIKNKTQKIVNRVRDFILNTKSSNTVYALVITSSGDIKRVPYKNILQNEKKSSSYSKNNTPTKLIPIKEKFKRAINSI